MKITLLVKAVTGRVRYYPVGEAAPHVLQLTQKKTLSELDVEALKALGCELEKVTEEAWNKSEPPRQSIPVKNKPTKKGWW